MSKLFATTQWNVVIEARDGTESRDLDGRRFPRLTMLDLRLQKRLAIGRLRATLDLDVFNTLNTASTLRQFGEATSLNFRKPLEIVAPRLVRLGLQLQF